MFLIAYLFTSAGISIIITQGNIFERTRSLIEKISPFFGEAISCPMCVGFWVGIFLALLGVSPAHVYLFPFIESTAISNKAIYYFMYFLDGPISSMLSWGFYNLIDFLQKKHIYDLLDKDNMLAD